jgi:hypothetical protein
MRGALGLDLIKRGLAFVHLSGLLDGRHIRQTRKASGCFETLKSGGMGLIESLALGTIVHFRFPCSQFQLLTRKIHHVG